MIKSTDHLDRYCIQAGMLRGIAGFILAAVCIAELPAASLFFLGYMWWNGWCLGTVIQYKDGSNQN